MALRYPLYPAEDKTPEAGAVIRFQVIQMDKTSQQASVAGSTVVSGTNSVSNEFDPFGSANNGEGEVIYINLPSGIQLSDGVGYGQRDINFVGQGILSSGAVIGGNNPTAAQADVGRQEAARLVGQLLGVSASAVVGSVLSGGNIFGAGIGGAFGADQLGAALDLASQTRFNPNTKTLLERVSIRSPTFSFNMIPTSKEEAIMIRNIIKAFRVSMYPLVTTTGVGDIVGFMRYPNKFKIDIYSGLGEAQDPYHISFLPCYLTSCSTTYNSTSTSYFEDGSPVETNLTLTFIEERSLTRQDLLNINDQTPGI